MNEIVDVSTRFRQVCQLLLSLIVGAYIRAPTVRDFKRSGDTFVGAQCSPTFFLASLVGDLVKCWWRRFNTVKF